MLPVLYCACGIPVRGMMYYREALELQYFLDFAEDKGTISIFLFHCITIYLWYCELDVVGVNHLSFTWQQYLEGIGSLIIKQITELWRSVHRHWQIWSSHMLCPARSMVLRRSPVNRETVVVMSIFWISCWRKWEILTILLVVWSGYLYFYFEPFRYPSLRVAYIDERDENVNGKSEKVYYSVLVKGGDKLDEVWVWLQREIKRLRQQMLFLSNQFAKNISLLKCDLTFFISLE